MIASNNDLFTDLFRDYSDEYIIELSGLLDYNNNKDHSNGFNLFSKLFENISLQLLLNLSGLLNVKYLK